jgi:hypothetical protein
VPVERREVKVLKCKVCGVEAVEGGFCLVHSKAYENIVGTYSVWRKALKIPWREYLSEIEQNPLTGEWVKEVANYLINKEATGNGEES